MLRSRSLALTLAVALALIAPAASAGTIIPKFPLQAFMDGNQEVPPTGSLALGIAQMSITSTGILTLEASVLGLEPPVLTGFHIHAPAGPGEPAGVIVDLGIANWTTIDEFPMLNGMVFFGVYDISGLPQADLDAILSNNSYLNLHTFDFIGGEIRGQIILVPEPSTAMLMALGLVGLARAGRRRQR